MVVGDLVEGLGLNTACIIISLSMQHLYIVEKLVEPDDQAECENQGIIQSKWARSKPFNLLVNESEKKKTKKLMKKRNQSSKVTIESHL